MLLLFHKGGRQRVNPMLRTFYRFNLAKPHKKWISSLNLKQIWSPQLTKTTVHWSIHLQQLNWNNILVFCLIQVQFPGTVYIFTVFTQSAVLLRKVSLSTKARTQSPCTFSQLNRAFPNTVNWWWMHSTLCTLHDPLQRKTAAGYILTTRSAQTPRIMHCSLV